MSSELNGENTYFFFGWLLKDIYIYIYIYINFIFLVLQMLC